MTTTPNTPNPDDDSSSTDDSPADGRGAEIGITEEEGSSFEPEEDPEPQG
jgi:hypothetical protein